MKLTALGRGVNPLGLTDHQMKVFELLARGHSQTEIAAKLGQCKEAVVTVITRIKSVTYSTTTIQAVLKIQKEIDRREHEAERKAMHEALVVATEATYQQIATLRTRLGTAQYK